MIEQYSTQPHECPRNTQKYVCVHAHVWYTQHVFNLWPVCTVGGQNILPVNKCCNWHLNIGKPISGFASVFKIYRLRSSIIEIELVNV